MQKLKNWFNSQTAKNKRLFILIAGGIALLLALYLFLGNPPEQTNKKKQDDVIRSVLTDKDTRNMSVESLSAELKNTKNMISDLTKEINRLQQELKVSQDMNTGMAPVIQNQITKLTQEQQNLNHQIEAMRKQGGISSSGAASNVFQTAPSTEQPIGEGGSDSTKSYEEQQLEKELGSLSDVFTRTPVDDMTQPSNTIPTTTNEANKQAVQEAQGNGFEIKSYTQEQPKEDPAAKAKEKEKKEMLYLPAGSIITATFINGLDAPTGQGARREPFPAALRVQHEAILPNHFRADIRECFLLISGYGELSSERAYLRGETLSCVRSDGGVIETRLESYAVGEDGKAGVKGRLVSKQGQIIARALLAGMLSGMSEAFNVEPVPIIATQSTGSTQFQDRGGFGGEFFRSAAAKGASNAMEKIADYYLEMAEGIFPVIEITSGRQIDIIITRGTELRIRNQR